MANFYIQLADKLMKLDSNFIDLINNPFTCDDNGEFNLSDENGNIIAKFDKNGLRVTEVSTNTVNTVNVYATDEVEADNHKLTLKADRTYVDDEISKLSNNVDNIDFDNLKNNPFVTDETGTLKIVDENGNVVALVDKNGIHSVEMSALDVSGKWHHLTEKLNKTEFEEVISVDNNVGELSVADLDGNIAFKVDGHGAISSEFTAGEHHLTEKLNKSEFEDTIKTLDSTIIGNGDTHQISVVVKQVDGKLNNVTVDDSNVNFNYLKENPVTVDNTGDFVVADANNKVGLKLNSNGLYVKEVIAGKHTLTSKASITDLNNKIATLDSEVSNAKDNKLVTVTVSQTDGKLSNVVVDDTTAKYELANLNNTFNNVINPDGTVGELTIADESEASFIGFKLNADGAKAKDFITSSNVSLNDVDERLGDIETLLQEDDDNVINNLKEVIDYFKDVQETETGVALLSTVATHTSNISTLSGNVNTVSSATETNKSKINDLTENAVFKEGDQTITGRKTFTLGPKFNVTGDTNAIAIGTDTRFNVLSGDTISDNTVLGMISDKPTLGHEDYETQVRGKKISIGSSKSKTTIQGSDTKLTYNGKNLAFEEDTASKLKALKFTYGISAGKTGTITYDGTNEEVLYIPTSIGHLNSNDTNTLKSEIIESAITFTTNQGYATQTWVNNKGYLTSSSLDGYAKTSDVNKKQNTISDLTTIRNNASSGATAYGWGNHANAGYAKTSDINKKQDAISDLATIRSNASSGATAYGWGDHSKKGYLTSSSLNGYATETWVTKYVTSAVTGGQVSLDGYATEEWVTNKGYLTEHQDISNLATKSEVEALTADVVENEYAMSTALNQIIVSAGFDSNGISTLPSGETLTNAIKRLDNACANATEGLKYSTERVAYVTTFTYVSEDGGSENYEITTEQRNYNIETHRKAFNGEICTLNVSGMIYNYIYTMGNITNGSAIFATTDVMKRHIQIQANGNCLSFVEEIQVNLEGYATEDWVTEYVVSAVTGGQVSLDGYATENWVNNKGYLTSSNLSGYAKTSDVNKKQDTISDLATIRSNASSGATAYGWGDHSKKGYLTSSSLNGYAKEDWVTSYVVSAVTDGQVSLDGYATENWVNSKNYLTSSSLNGYAKTSDVNKKQDAISDLATIRSNASSGATAYGWGNHANAGYAKTSDVNKKQDAISDLATIRNNASSGATAYGWGDHSKKGYLTSSNLSGYAKTSDLASYLSKSGGQINGSLIINDESHNHITLTDDGEMYYDAKISYSDGTLGVYSGNRIDILSPISVKSKITVSNEYSGFTCTNLNADLLDGKHASEFMLKTDSFTGSVTYDDITDAPLVNNGDGEFHITDESNYKIATFNNDGLYTTRVTSINGFFQNSDETLKDFQNEVEVDFARLKNIPKVYYTWKDDAEKTLQIGTSAQKVNEVYPELTTTDVDSGRMVLDYAKLSIIALKAIDTLHEENQLLRKELEELKEKVNTKRTRKKKTE